MIKAKRKDTNDIRNNDEDRVWIQKSLFCFVFLIRRLLCTAPQLNLESKTKTAYDDNCH